MRTNRHDPPYPVGGDDATVGQLIEDLQSIASRYGSSTPVAIPTAEDADYEQAFGPIVLHAVRETSSDDWDLFHVDSTGEAVAVLV